MLLFVFQYLFTVAVSLLHSFSQKHRRALYVAVFFILFFFAASRGQYVGRDYGVYTEIFGEFISSRNYFTAENIAFYEPAFFIIPAIARLIFGTGYIIASFVFFAFLGVFFKLKATYLSNSFFLSVALYAGSFFLLHEMTQIRVGVASGILLMGIRYIKQKNLGKFLLIILCACFFHYSSILFLPVYFLSDKPIFRIKYVILLILAYAIAISKINVLEVVNLGSLSPKLELYNKLANKGQNANINIFNIGSLVNVFILLILLSRANFLANFNKYFILMFKIYFLSIFLYLILSPMPVLAIRTSELFGTVQYCLIPSLIYLFDRKEIGYYIGIFVSIVAFFLYVFYTKIFNKYQVWWY